MPFDPSFSADLVLQVRVLGGDLMDATQERTCSVDGCTGELDGRHGALCGRHRYLRDRYGSETADPRAERECKCCSWSFEPVRAGQLYCSPDCRREAWAEARREAANA